MTLLCIQPLAGSILKTNLVTHTQAHAILFSTDLEQAFDQIIRLYSLRFQIEFHFRDAKQYWGLEDFMISKKSPLPMPPISPFSQSMSARLCCSLSANTSPTIPFWI